MRLGCYTKRKGKGRKAERQIMYQIAENQTRTNFSVTVELKDGMWHVELTNHNDNKTTYVRDYPPVVYSSREAVIDMMYVASI